MGKKIVKEDYIGKRFFKLVILSFVGFNKHKRHMWECLCDCGIKKNIETQSLTSGNTKSCGCIRHDGLPPERRSRKFAPIVCGIYKITNPENKVYIGSSRTIYKRWLRHREANRKIRLHDSLRQFGWETHKFEIIHELPFDVNDNVLLQYEQLYIDLYKNVGSVMLNVKEAGSAGKFPDESKKKMSLAQMGKTPWNKGIKGGNAMAEQYKKEKHGK